MAMWHWFAGGIVADAVYTENRSRTLSSGDPFDNFVNALGALTGAVSPWYFNYWGSGDPGWGLEWWQCLIGSFFGAAIGLGLAPIVFAALIIYGISLLAC